MSSNLALWEAVEKTPTEHTKAITGKAYQGTSPKPHYLIHKATETFGPCGIGWGFKVANERIEEGADGEKMHIAHVHVWFKWNGERGEVEHVGGTPFSGKRRNGSFFTDEDAPKKSVTDALVKALSMIGFAGDIFMGRYDDSKYVSELKADERKATQPEQPKNEETRKHFSSLETSMRENKTRADLASWWKDSECVQMRSQLPKDWQTNLHNSFKEYGLSLPVDNKDAA